MMMWCFKSWFDEDLLLFCSICCALHLCFFRPQRFICCSNPSSASTAVHLICTRYTSSYSETRNIIIYVDCWVLSIASLIENHLIEPASKQQSSAVPFYRYVAFINHCSCRLVLISSFAATISRFIRHCDSNCFFFRLGDYLLLICLTALLFAQCSTASSPTWS